MASLSNKDVTKHLGKVENAAPPESRDYMSSTVDNTKTPVINMVPHADGYQSCTVEWFKSLVSSDEELAEFSMTSSAVLQQYLRIPNMVIKITTPIDYSYAKERQSDTFSGASLVYGDIVLPKRMDHFILDVGADLPFLFTITNVEPKAVYGGSKAYEIEYSSSGRMTPERRKVLDSKTVDTKYYVEDYLLDGRDPLLSDRQMSYLDEFRSHGGALIDMFIQDNIVATSDRYLLIPDQRRTTIDVYLQDVLINILDVSEYPDLKTFNHVSIRSIPEARRKTIWDVLLSGKSLKSSGYSHRIVSKMLVYPIASVSAGKYSDPILRSLYYTTVRDIYLPSDLSPVISQGEPLRGGKERISDVSIMLGDVSDVDVANIKRDLIKPVTTDDYYVFSESFYKYRPENMSELEYQTYLMLENKEVDKDTIISLCEACYTWGSLERYYYIPILLILLKHSMLGLSR